MKSITRREFISFLIGGGIAGGSAWKINQVDKTAEVDKQLLNKNFDSLNYNDKQINLELNKVKTGLYDLNMRMNKMEGDDRIPFDLFKPQKKGEV